MAQLNRANFALAQGVWNNLAFRNIQFTVDELNSLWFLTAHALYALTAHAQYARRSWSS
jgi:hypothetical protein